MLGPCWRQVSITVSTVLTKPLPLALCVPKRASARSPHNASHVRPRRSSASATHASNRRTMAWASGGCRARTSSLRTASIRTVFPHKPHPRPNQFLKKTPPGCERLRSNSLTDMLSLLQLFSAQPLAVQPQRGASRRRAERCRLDARVGRLSSANLQLFRRGLELLGFALEIERAPVLKNVPPHSFINIHFPFQLIEPSIQVIKVGLISVKLFLSCGSIQTWIASLSSGRLLDDLHGLVDSEFFETRNSIFPYNASRVEIELMVSPNIHLSDVPYAVSGKTAVGRL